MPAEPSTELARKVISALAGQGATVATAESLTAGLLCAELTEIPGASEVVRGGLVVYATELKVSLAGVDAALLQRHGPVHPEVAAALAEGARVRCGATWGVGLTGVAGPASQDGVAAGTVHIGLAGARVRETRTVQLPGERADVRQGTVRAALELLTEQLC